MRKLSFILALVLVVLVPPSLRAGDMDIAVFVDAGDNQGLIAAIQNANNGSGPDLIFVRPGPDGNRTFIFDQPFENSDAALPAITNATTSIFPTSGTGSRITFTRNPSAPNFRFANVIQDGELELGAFIVETFQVDGDGGAIAASGASRVNLDGTSFRNNIASGAGGAISMTENSRLILGNRRIGGALLVTEFRENRAGNVGGAVSITGSATGNIRQTLFADNNATVFGCDLNVSSNGRGLSGAALVVTDSTFAADCPNVLVENPLGLLQLRNNTFAGTGDALDTTDLVILFSNLFANSPTTNKLGADNLNKAVCNDFNIGDITSEGFNIETTNSCSLNQPTDQPNTDPMVAAPDPGGVVALLAGSPAIDQGASSMLASIEGKLGLPCGYKDARGLGRPQDANLDGTYECDIGSYEMQGGPNLTAGQTGAYFDPSRSGEGAFVEMLDGNAALVAEFSYAVDGSGPIWFVGIGDVVGNSVVVDDLLQPLGGVFGAGFNADLIERESVGGMSLVFSNCQASTTPGKQVFQSSAQTAFGDLFVDLARLTTVVDCQGNASPQSGRSGSFFDPDRSGEGIFVQWRTDGQVLLIWYTFDPQGNQFWTISDTVTISGNSLTASMLYPASSTSFGENFNGSEIDLQPWGSVTLEYQPGCTDVSFSYDSEVAGFGSGAYSYTRLTTVAGTSCDL